MRGGAKMNEKNNGNNCHDDDECNIVAKIVLFFMSAAISISHWNGLLTIKVQFVCLNGAEKHTFFPSSHLY